MYVRGITILPREDSVMEKGLKKLIKGPCPLKDMATAWELKKVYLINIMKCIIYYTTFSINLLELAAFFSVDC